jgi:hypothetical protein
MERSRYVTAGLLTGCLTLMMISCASAYPSGTGTGTGTGLMMGVALGSFPETLTYRQNVDDMAAVHDLGARSVRMELNWSITEPAPGRYDWSAGDRIFDALDAQGLAPLILITKTPGWARANGEPSNLYLPSDPVAISSFAAAAVQHYRDRGRTGAHMWEIWDEPNTTYHMGTPTDYAKYVAVMRSAYSAIKAADPGATVSLGGILRGGSPSSSDFVLDTVFLQKLYEYGVKGSFDVVAFHPYFYGYDPADRSTTSENQGWNRVAPMHDVMASNGDGDKPIWITECGQQNGSSFGATSEQAQAKSLLVSVERAKELPYVSGLWWYMARDSGTDPRHAESNYGLLRFDGSLKPVATAYRQAAGSLPE